MWRDIAWSEFCDWVRGKTLLTTEDGRYIVTMHFQCGSVAEVRSNYDRGYSEYTPGNGIEPPTVRVLDPKPEATP